MAGTLQFDLVSPERRLASVVATEVNIPGADGDLTAMEGHAPTITTLRAGVLKIASADGVKSFVVTGGFAEISASSVSVLAERAVPVEELTAALMDQLIADASEATAVAVDKDAADKAMADLVAMRAAAGYQNQHAPIASCHQPTWVSPPPTADRPDQDGQSVCNAPTAPSGRHCSQPRPLGCFPEPPAGCARLLGLNRGPIAKALHHRPQCFAQRAGCNQTEIFPVERTA